MSLLRRLSKSRLGLNLIGGGTAAKAITADGESSELGAKECDDKDKSDSDSSDDDFRIEEEDEYDDDGRSFLALRMELVSCE